MFSPVRSNVRALRARRGWSQTRLGAMAGITRQGLAAIEGGRSVPSTEVALRLARALDVSVEELFRLGDDAAREEVLERAGLGVALPGRVRLATVAGRRRAYGVGVADAPAGASADGVAELLPDGRARVRLLPATAPPPELVVAGCDPAFGLVEELLRRERGITVLRIPAGSGAALEALGRGEVHVAGVHLPDPGTGRYNAGWIERVVPFPTTRVVFAVWEQVLLLPAGNPLGVRCVDDLVQPGVRFVNREPGSGSRMLAELRLAAAGIAVADVPGFLDTEADGHESVGAAIAAGVANAGVAIRAVGRARHLVALPLAVEPYELVVPDHFLELSAIGALLDSLRRPGLIRQVEALGGYDATRMGRPA